MSVLLHISNSSLARGLCWSSCRYYHAPAFYRPAPPPSGSIQTPQDLLKAIGRSCETKLKVDDWEQLWKMGGYGMKSAGVGVKDRRYIMWALNKFRNRKDNRNLDDLSDVAHEEKPKKKIRGWGPAVQFGKRIRSRRH